MYSLTLTKSERKAIDWVGGRYSHGDDLRRLLYQCEWVVLNLDEDGCEWDNSDVIEFRIPENVAWQIAEIIEEGLDCFSDDLCEKLYRFQNSIV